MPDDDHSLLDAARSFLSPSDDDSDELDNESEDESYTFSNSTYDNIREANSPRHDSATPGFVRPSDGTTEVITGASGNNYRIRVDEGGWRFVRMYGDLEKGRSIQNMDANTIEEWFLEETFREFSHNAAGEAYAGERNGANGVDGVKKLVLEHASDAIDDRIGYGEDAAEAFNNVAQEWPREAQAMLCSNELSRDRPASYQNDCEAFAEAHDVMDLDLGQTELDLFYDENPFTQEDLSREEAAVIMLLRMNDHETDGILDQVDDCQAFAEYYKKTGDVNAALNAHEYDTVFTMEDLAVLAPPDEWPDDMDPSNVNRENCAGCRRTHYEVYANSGRAWMTGSGDLVGGETLGDEYMTTRSLMCESCFDSWNDNKSVAAIFGASGTALLEGTSTLTRRSTDPGWDDYDDLSSSNAENLHSACCLSDPMGYETISPDESAPASHEMEQAIIDLIDPDTQFENGTVIVVNINDSIRSDEAVVHVPDNNAALAQEVKQKIAANMNEPPLVAQ